MDLHHHAVEFDVELWPVEHPKEPQDEDRPLKCPIPASSLVNVRKFIQTVKVLTTIYESLSLLILIDCEPYF